jgi:alpha-tubulin suppressor-like RCC1 family protein
MTAYRVQPPFRPCHRREEWRGGGRRRALAALIGATVLMAGGAVPAAAAPHRPAISAAVSALGPGSLFTWGDELYGKLGNGSLGNSYGGAEAAQEDSPVPIALPSSVRQLVAFGNNGAALLTDGTVEIWGGGNEGQLGDGSYSARATPAAVPGLSGITQLAGGSGSVLALDSDGAVWVWGGNTWGEAGNGTRDTDIPTPQLVPGLSGVIQVAAGESSDYALKSDGTVWAWGLNNGGQLGDGTTLDRLYPSQVLGLTGITGIAAGDFSAYAIRADGSAMAWGDNILGQLGNGTSLDIATVPAPIPGLAGVTQIAASGGSAFALTGTAGTVWAWGYNAYGGLGDGTTTSRLSPEQIGLSSVTQISAGDNTTVAMLTNGSVMTWGDNSEGGLGIGTNDQNLHPSPVLVRSLAGATLVSTGYSDVMVIASPWARIPSLIDDTQAEAAQALQIAGFVLGRVSTVLDLTCQYVGVVKTQTLAAGTPEPPGTSVSVTIGKAGGKCIS